MTKKEQILTTQAAREKVAIRWKNTTVAERKRVGAWLAEQRKIARLRSGIPRCPCGASTLHRAEMRNFDCCRRAIALLEGIRAHLKEIGRNGENGSN